MVIDIIKLYICLVTESCPSSPHVALRTLPGQEKFSWFTIHSLIHAGIRPASNDTGKNKMQFCLQGVIAGNAVGEGRISREYCDDVPMLYRCLVVDYGVDS